jgi:hypothetical protein
MGKTGAKIVIIVEIWEGLFILATKKSQWLASLAFLI